MSICAENILICGASPDRLNSNVLLRRHVANGFREVTTGVVQETPLELAGMGCQGLRYGLVVIFGSCMPDLCDYLPLRRWCDQRGIPLVFWLHDDPYEFDCHYKLLGIADRIFSNDKWATLHYDHPHVHHLPLAACPTFHFRPWRAEKERDLFFCGVAFDNRIRLFYDCADWLSRYRVDVYGAGWPSDLKVGSNRKIPNENLSDYYAGSRLTINCGRHLSLANHRYCLAPSTPGPRTFEAAMAGTVQCFFVESLEICEYFEFGAEIEPFDHPAQLAAIIRRVTEDPQGAEQTARAAQAKVLAHHTYAHRAAELLRVCGLSAPPSSAV